VFGFRCTNEYRHFPEELWWEIFIVLGGSSCQDGVSFQTLNLATGPVGLSAIAAWHELEIAVAGTAATFSIDGTSIVTGIAAANSPPKR
jgi:hypothetical protein